MLEKPDISDQTLLARLRDEYRLPFAQVTFLPLGADANAAVYRAASEDGAPFFLKLTRRPLDEISVLLPRYLQASGSAAVIAPLETRAGQLFGSLPPYRMILYPYVEGRDGYQVGLTDRQWSEFGTALKTIHSIDLPPELAARIPREDFSPRWRDRVHEFLEQTRSTSYPDPVAARMAAFFQSHRDVILQTLDRAGQLARDLAARSADFVLCHSDLHPGNLLVTASGVLFIVDWDNPLYAPKEKDLALIGGCKTWHDPRDVLLFYRGYGPAPVDRRALAYYRYERVIMDLAEFGEQILLSFDGGGDAREQAYAWFTNNFQPGGEIELAKAIDGEEGRDLGLEIGA